MTEPYGPIWAGGVESITKSGYKICFLPELHNDELQREGKPPVYYWLPNEVRLARKDGDTGDYRFSMIHFEGVMSSSTTVGANATNEVAGGVLNFSTTSAPPGATLKEAEEDLLNRWRGHDDKYWGWRTSAAPMFRPAVIVSNTTSVSNLAPGPDGSVPAVTPTAGPAPGPGGPAPGGNGRGMDRGLPPAIELSRSMPVLLDVPRSVPMKRGYRGGIDPMFFRMQGQGPGSVLPDAANAYTALLGSIQAAIVWASFHGSTSALSVWQQMQLRVWSPMMRLVIDGDWDKIQDHFSAAGHAGGLFWGADVQVQFNELRMNGGITVTTEVDSTLPNADKLQAEMDKRTDLVFQKFMDQAQKVIFDPPPFNEQPAQASGGFLGFGGGVAMKLRRDHSHLHLHYEEHKELAYLQPYPISGTLDGLYDEIKADPAAEKKYFTTVYLGDWDRKVVRNIKPIVNWPDPTQKWVGEPIAFIGVQVGYPNTAGVVQWDSKVFQATDPPDKGYWTSATEMKSASDVVNPPRDWTPDKTFIKRTIHFNEAPNPNSDPFVRVQIEKQVVDLDPGELGTLTTEANPEVRASNAGLLGVGPISIDAVLDTGQVVEVTFQALGQVQGKDRDPVKFSWSSQDQDQPRYWMLATGDVTFVPKFKYQVHVVTKHSLFSKGQEWFGAWVESGASGPFMVSVPTPGDPGVVTKAIPFGALTAALAKAARPTVSSDGQIGAPPTQPVGSPPPTSGGAVGPPPPASKAAPSGDYGSRAYSGWTLGPPSVSAGTGAKGAPPTNGAEAEPVTFESFAPQLTGV